ncbi:PAS domain-containing protein [bacterium]|nr:PAS domain-containing protein [bacterium]
MPNLFDETTALDLKKTKKQLIIELKYLRNLVSINGKDYFVRIAQDILDGYQANIAIIDEQGSILMVNAAWRSFASENGSNPEYVSEGSNYFDVCQRATGIDAEDIHHTASILRAVLKGKPVGFSTVYPCHSPNTRRWFCLRATPVVFDGLTRVMVAHEDITDFKLVEESLRESEERMRVVFETTQSSIFQVESSGSIILISSTLTSVRVEITT